MRDHLESQLLSKDSSGAGIPNTTLLILAMRYLSVSHMRWTNLTDEIFQVDTILC